MLLSSVLFFFLSFAHATPQTMSYTCSENKKGIGEEPERLRHQKSLLSTKLKRKRIPFEIFWYASHNASEEFFEPVFVFFSSIGTDMTTYRQCWIRDYAGAWTFGMEGFLPQKIVSMTLSKPRYFKLPQSQEQKESKLQPLKMLYILELVVQGGDMDADDLSKMITKKAKIRITVSEVEKGIDETITKLTLKRIK